MPKIQIKGQSVETGERPQTNGRMDANKRIIDHVPYYTVDKDKIR